MLQKMFIFLVILISMNSYITAQYYEVYIKCVNRWTAKSRHFTIDRSGNVCPACGIANYLHGNLKPYRKKMINAGPLFFETNYPVDGELIFLVEKVSVRGKLKAHIDGKFVCQIDLPAGSGKGPWKKTEYVAKYKIYQSTYNQEYKIKVPKGRHSIKIENCGVDWVRIGYFVFTNYSKQNKSGDYMQWKKYEMTLEQLPIRIKQYKSDIEKLVNILTKGDNNYKTIPTLKLQLQNLKKLAVSRRPVNIDLMRTEKELSEILAYVNEGKDYFALKRGRCKRGYFSKIDNTYQPYDIMIPNHYDSKRKYALLILMHGYEVEIQKDANFLWADSDPALDKLGLIKAAVYGRRNHYYLGAGENDVLTVIDDITRNYSIDPDRIYIGGASMGGYGTWKIGLMYPDHFAAISPLCGSVDYTKSTFAHFPKGSDQNLLKSVSPYFYIQNAMHLPVKIYHGGIDPVISVKNSRKIVKALGELGYKYEYTEYPKVAHDVWNNADADPERLLYLLDCKRNPYPDIIEHKTFYLRTGKAYWIEITQKQIWEKFASVKAQIKGNKIEIQVQNIAEFTIDLGIPQLRKIMDLKIIINGQMFSVENNMSTKQMFHYTKQWEHGSLRLQGLKKQKFLEGPWLDGEKGPFKIIYGTMDKSKIERLKKIGKRLLRHYKTFAMEPELISDTQTIENNYGKDYNLYLLGNPNENLYFRNIAAKLPVKFKRNNNFSFLGKKYDSHNFGVRMIYPNPANLSRYVLVDVFPDNTRQFTKVIKYLVPDYMIYKIIDRKIKIDQQGFFGRDWK